MVEKVAQEAKSRVYHNNLVEVEGYLKENTLEETYVGKEETGDRRPAISGTITVALSDSEDYRFRFTAPQTYKSGKVNKDYETLKKLLPGNVVSLGTLLKTNPTLTFEAAIQQASKVWVRGSFELYDRKVEGGNILTSVTLRGGSAGEKTTLSRTPFTLKAKFDVEGSVDYIKDEKNKEGEETGRKLVGISLPDGYREVSVPIEFVCETPSSISQIDQYSVGSFGRFVGTLHNKRIEVEQRGKRTEFMDGSTEDTSRVTYDFVNERHMEKMTYPYEEDHEKYVSADTMRAYKLNREKNLEELEVQSNSPKKAAPMGGSEARNPHGGFQL